MHDLKQIRREVLLFVALVLGSTTACALLAKLLVPGLSHLLMMLPLLSAFGVQKFVVRRPLLPDLGFRLGHRRYLLLAPLILGGFSALSLLVTVLLEPSALVSAAELKAKLDAIGIFASWPLALRVLGVFSLDCLLGLVLNIPLFLGEEVGWRAFLGPRLDRLLGPRGLLIGGFIWAIWHLPMIYLFGLNYPENPILGTLLWIPLCTCLSILFQHLYQKSNSVFAVALAHGALNKVAVMGLFLLIHDQSLSRLLYGPQGLVGLALLAPVAAYLYRRQPRQC